MLTDGTLTMVEENMLLEAVCQDPDKPEEGSHEDRQAGKKEGYEFDKAQLDAAALAALMEMGGKQQSRSHDSGS